MKAFVEFIKSSVVGGFFCFAANLPYPLSRTERRRYGRGVCSVLTCPWSWSCCSGSI